MSNTALYLIIRRCPTRYEHLCCSRGTFRFVPATWFLNATTILAMSETARARPFLSFFSAHVWRSSEFIQRYLFIFNSYEKNYENAKMLNKTNPLKKSGVSKIFSYGIHRSPMRSRQFDYSLALWNCARGCLRNVKAREKRWRKREKKMVLRVPVLDRARYVGDAIIRLSAARRR